MWGETGTVQPPQEVVHVNLGAAFFADARDPQYVGRTGHRWGPQTGLYLPQGTGGVQPRVSCILKTCSILSAFLMRPISVFFVKAVSLSLAIPV